MASCRELEVVREALSRILQEHNPLPPHQRLARDAELSARIHGGGHEHRHGAEGGLEIEDKRLVSRLLQQVGASCPCPVCVRVQNEKDGRR
jgi:hypothetical protein